MVLDINLFRPEKGGDLELVRESQRRRFADTDVVDQVAALDAQWRSVGNNRQTLSMQFNALNKEIAIARKAGRDTQSQQHASKALKASIEQIQMLEASLQSQRDQLLAGIGNLVHDSVPVARDEAHNQVTHESHSKRMGQQDEEHNQLLGHAELVQRLGMVDQQAGVAAAGGRAYYLMREGVLLNQALISYGLHFMNQRGWTPVTPPYWLTGATMARCAQLAQFDEELYRVTDDSEHQTTPSSSKPSPAPHHLADFAQPASQPFSSQQDRSSQPTEGNKPGSATRYLIATAEQPLCALHQDGWLEAADLPLRYAGFSTCFRREAGSHGKDTLGIFRVHQFDKVEQFALTAPGESSWHMMDDMLKNLQDFYASLGIPYRLVRIASGALNAAASAKVDLEGWFPASGAYRELVSASNCTDYQARNLGIRVRVGPGLALPRQAGSARQAEAGGTANSVHVHMLNATLTATQRTLCCLLENHQTPEGIQVPAVLRPYLGGLDFIPFNGAAQQQLAKLGKLGLQQVRK